MHLKFFVEDTLLSFLPKELEKIVILCYYALENLLRRGEQRRPGKQKDKIYFL
jgi:hypothetical protein